MGVAWRETPPVRHPWTLLGVIAVLVLFTRLGAGSLRDWDEAIYARVALEMWNASEWLTPSQFGQPWFEKPPFFLWITALGYELFGVGELAPRLGSAASGLIAVLMTYALGGRMFGPAVGWLAAIILLGTPHFVTSSRMGMLDVPLTMATVVCIHAWWRGLTNPRWFLCVGLAVGVATMTKGAAAIVIPVLLFGHVLLGGHWSVFRSPWLWGGVGVAFALVAPWHFAMWQTHGDEFVDMYLGFHVLARATTAIEAHSSGPFFYLGVLLEEQRPWVLLSAIAVPALIRSHWRAPDSATALLIAWLGAALAIPTLVSTRLPWYVMPIYPALSLAIALATLRWSAGRHDRRVLAVAIGIVVLNFFVTKRILRPDYSPDVKALAEEIQERVPEEQPLCVYRRSWPAVGFYGQRNVVRVRAVDDERLRGFSTAQGTLTCVTKARLLGELEAWRGEVVAREGDLVLLEIPAANLR